MGSLPPAPRCRPNTMPGVDEMRLLLARHGHATSGPDHRWTAEDRLTGRGLQQADELADHLASIRRPPTRASARRL